MKQPPKPLKSASYSTTGATDSTTTSAAPPSSSYIANTKQATQHSRKSTPQKQLRTSKKSSPTAVRRSSWPNSSLSTSSSRAKCRNGKRGPSNATASSSTQSAYPRS